MCRSICYKVASIRGTHARLEIISKHENRLRSTGHKVERSASCMLPRSGFFLSGAFARMENSGIVGGGPVPLRPTAGAGSWSGRSPSKIRSGGANSACGLRRRASWRLATAFNQIYLAACVLTEILRLGRFGSGAGDDRYGTIATAMARDANARDSQVTEHSDARGRYIYGQTT